MFGQAPRLMLNRRAMLPEPRLDVANLTRMTTANTLDVIPVVVPGQRSDPRSPQDVVSGLGLPQPLEAQLAEAVATWMALDPIAMRTTAWVALRQLAPTDPILRSELWSRVCALHRSKRWAKSLQLVWIGLDGALDLDADGDLVKGAGHKYLKRTPTGKQKPRWRYFYKLPKTGRIVGADDLKVGAKFKALHQDEVGHFELLADHGKHVALRHDETQKTIHVRKRDLPELIAAGHRKHAERLTAKPAAKPKDKAEAKPAEPPKAEPLPPPQAPEPKAPEAPPPPAEPAVPQQPKAPADIPRVTLDDLAAGHYEAIEGFASTEAQAHDVARALSAKDGSRDHALIRQPGGYVVVSRSKAAEAGPPPREKPGADAELFVRSANGSDKLKASWVLVDAGDLVASHDPSTFAVRGDYPANVQERRYHEIDAERHKVDRIARDLEPAIVINTNPDGVNGAPVVTEDNVVLGGNGRTMAAQRAYALYPESAAKLKAHLAARASHFGLRPSDVHAMKHPMLVRRIAAGTDPAALRLLGRRLNEGLTQGLDPRSEEVAIGKTLVTGDVLDALTAGVGEDQTLNDYMTHADSKPFVAALRRAGIVDEINQAKFVDQETGLLNEDGRSRVERVLAARFLPDAAVLDRMSPSLRSNLARATASLVAAERAGWDLRTPLMAAAKADMDMRAKGFRGGDKEIGRYLSQGELGAVPGPAAAVQGDPLAARLLTVIREHNSPRKMPAAFRGFALRARGQQDEASAGVLPGFEREPETPLSALDAEFGLKPPQRAMWAASMPAPDWAKASGAAKGKGAAVRSRLVDRAIRHAKDLVSAHVSLATGQGREPVVPVEAIVAAVMADIRHSLEHDPVAARALGRTPIGPATLRGIVTSLAAMAGDKQAADRARLAPEVTKAAAFVLDLLKAQQLDLFGARPATPSGPPKPPPGFTAIIGSKRGGYHKRVGDHFVYWYPDTGVVNQPHADDAPAHPTTASTPVDPHHAVPVNAAPSVDDMARDANGHGIDKDARYVVWERHPSASRWMRVRSFYGTYFLPHSEGNALLSSDRHKVVPDGEDANDAPPVKLTIPADQVRLTSVARLEAIGRSPKDDPTAVTTEPTVPAAAVEEGGKYETTGYVFGSRAELWELNNGGAMRLDPAVAYKLVNRDKVLGGKVSPESFRAEREAGTDPEAAYAKYRLMDAIAKRPPDSAEHRQVYIDTIQQLQVSLAPCKTLADVQAVTDAMIEATEGKVTLAVWDREEAERRGYGLLTQPPSGDMGAYFQQRHPIESNLADDMADTAKAVTQNPLARAYAERQEDGSLVIVSHRRWNDPQTLSALKQLEVLGPGFLRLLGRNMKYVTRTERSNRNAPKFGAAVVGPEFVAVLAGGGNAHASKTLQDYKRELARITKAKAFGQDPDEAWDWMPARTRSALAVTRTAASTEGPDYHAIVQQARLGAYERKGPPVSTASAGDLKAQCRLHEVEYGHWADEAEKQWHTEATTAALSDLADMLGCKRDQIGQNGRLTMAIGSRGKGGKKAALAHYESTTKVINLTKEKGKGSLAHEWGHFLDHMLLQVYHPEAGHDISLARAAFSRSETHGNVPVELRGAMNDVVNAIRYGEHAHVPDAVVIKRYSDRLNSKLGELRALPAGAERAAATKAYNAGVTRYNNARRAHRNPARAAGALADMRRDLGLHSAFYAAAREMPAYWHDPAELFARSFEAHVSDRLEKAGRINTYLVKGAEREAAVLAEHKGIYPQGRDREVIGQAMDKLFEALREQEHFTKALGMLAEWRQADQHPPEGFAPISGSSLGGYRKWEGNGWLYWYPGEGLLHQPRGDDVPEALADRPGSADPAAVDPTDPVLGGPRLVILHSAVEDTPPQRAVRLVLGAERRS